MTDRNKQLLKDFNDAHEAFNFMMFKNHDLPLIVDDLLYRYIGKDSDYNLFILVLQHGMIAVANKSWCDAFGFKHEEVFKKNIFDFIHPDDIPKTMKAFERVKKEGELKGPFRNRYLCKDGSYKEIEWDIDVPILPTAVCGFAKVI